MVKTLIGWISDQLMKVETLSVFGCMVMLAIPSSGPFLAHWNAYSNENSKKKFRTRPTIAIDCTIHSREWISPAVCRSFINEYLRCGQANAENCDSYLLEKFYGFNIFILPMLNADGYYYSWNSDRLWRKNRTASPDGWDFQKKYLEMPGIDPGTSRMLSERSTIWATPPWYRWP